MFFLESITKLLGMVNRSFQNSNCLFEDVNQSFKTGANSSRFAGLQWSKVAFKISLSFIQ